MSKKFKYLIPSLALAGIGYFSTDSLTSKTNNDDNFLLKNVGKIDNDKVSNIFAGHRSHSSHASHGSHASHRSYYAPPEMQDPDLSAVPESDGLHASVERNVLSTPVKSILPSSPAILKKKNIVGTTNEFKKIVIEVQLALMARNFDIGVVDGFPGTRTMKSIFEYQLKNGLVETGRINDQLIKSLGINVGENS